MGEKQLWKEGRRDLSLVKEDEEINSIFIINFKMLHAKMAITSAQRFAIANQHHMLSEMTKNYFHNLI